MSAKESLHTKKMLPDVNTLACILILLHIITLMHYAKGSHSFFRYFYSLPQWVNETGLACCICIWRWACALWTLLLFLYLWFDQFHLFLHVCCECSRSRQQNDSHSYYSSISLPLTWRISFYSPTHTHRPRVCAPVCLCVCSVTFSFRKLVLPPLPPSSHSERKIWVWLLAWPLFYWACTSHGLDKCPAAWEASCSSAVLYDCITHPVPFLKSFFFSFYSSLRLMRLMRGTVLTSLCISLQNYLFRFNQRSSARLSRSGNWKSCLLSQGYKVRAG